MKRIFPILLILALVGGGTYYFLTRGQPQIVLTGIVTGDEYIASAQIQGRLQKVYVREGDTVSQGAILATIQPETQEADMTFFEQAVQQAKTQVQQAQADLTFTQAQTKSQIAQAQANLAAAVAQVAQGNADLENARLNFHREETAYKSGAESPQTYDQARTAFAAQQANVDALVKQQAAASAAVDVAKANLNQIAMKQAALDQSQHQREAAQAQEAKAKAMLSYTTVTAPISGIIDKRVSLEGEVVNPAQAIVTLIDPQKLWIRADVEETYVDLIHLGDQMQVHLPSGQVRAGTVYYRAVDADYATQRDVSRTKRDIKTFEIRLRVDNQDRALALGMTAYVSLPAKDSVAPTETAPSPVARPTDSAESPQTAPEASPQSAPQSTQ